MKNDNVAVPEGWQLVPKEPTEEMIAAGQDEITSGRHLIETYKDMLAAAPALTPAEKAGVGDGLTGEQKEVILLHIISEMGGETDSSESKWSWLNWFCKDEVHGKHSDTFNRCHEKGWLVTSHNTSFDTSTTSLSAAGKEFVADTAMTEAFVDWWNAAPSRALSTQGGGVERLVSLADDIEALQIPEPHTNSWQLGFLHCRKRAAEIVRSAARDIDRAALAAQGDDAQEER